MANPEFAPRDKAGHAKGVGRDGRDKGGKPGNWRKDNKLLFLGIRKGKAIGRGKGWLASEQPPGSADRAGLLPAQLFPAGQGKEFPGFFRYGRKPACSSSDSRAGKVNWLIFVATSQVGKRGPWHTLFVDSGKLYGPKHELLFRGRYL